MIKHWRSLLGATVHTQKISLQRSVGQEHDLMDERIIFCRVGITRSSCEVLTNLGLKKLGSKIPNLTRNGFILLRYLALHKFGIVWFHCEYGTSCLGDMKRSCRQPWATLLIPWYPWSPKKIGCFCMWLWHVMVVDTVKSMLPGGFFPFLWWFWEGLDSPEDAVVKDMGATFFYGESTCGDGAKYRRKRWSFRGIVFFHKFMKVL